MFRHFSTLSTITSSVTIGQFSTTILSRHSSVLVRHSSVLPRQFSTTTAVKDVISDLYLNELKSYKPVKSVQDSGLLETFVLPKPPVKPLIEGLDVAVVADASLEQVEWPALVDPIDDPANYNGIVTDIDNGSLFPTTLKEIHYHDH